jgi:hypothetical protein
MEDESQVRLIAGNQWYIILLFIQIRRALSRGPCSHIRKTANGLWFIGFFYACKMICERSNA